LLTLSTPKDCNNVPGGYSYQAPFGGAGYGNNECRGDKLNFIATVFFMITNAAAVAYAALFASEEAKKNAQK